MGNDLTFGQWLKRRRRGLGLTQRTLGKQTGYASETIRKVEADELRPSRQMAERLADALQIDPAGRERFVRFARDDADGDGAELPTQTVQVPAGQAALPGSALSRLDQNAEARHLPGQAGRRHLPIPLTPFVGRETELVELARMLRDPDCRLITLVGPGGIGKSRLALQTAQAHASAFPQGMWLVPLAPVTAPALLPSAIAGAMGFSFQGTGLPREQILDYLREKHALIILDSFEHLVDEASYLVELLQQAPQIVLLVTSRERLQLQAEWYLEVHGLAVPALLAGDDEIEQCSAVRLFESTGRRAGAELRWSSSALASVARICRLVEGLPLALELAAAWTRHRSLDQIADSIEHDLDFLATSMRDRPERHRSLRATFDSSWRQLSEAERSAFCQMTVFRGGFETEAAGQVTGASLLVMAALADKSFIRRERNGRYQMHELLRQFGAEKQAQTALGEGSAADRHSVYFVEFLQHCDRRLMGPDQPDAIAEIRADVDNIWIGWRRAVSHGDAAQAAQAAHALWSYIEIVGGWPEAVALFQWAVETATNRGSELTFQVARAQLRVYQGWFSHRMGRYAEARQLATSGLDDLIAVDAPIDIGFFMHVAACITWLMGDYAEARRLLEAEVATFRAQGDRWGEAAALGVQTLVDMSVGEHAKAAEAGRGVVAMFRELRDPRMLAHAFAFHGAQLSAIGERAAAAEHLRESLTISRSIGDRWSTASGLLILGQIYFSLHNFVEARVLQLESVDLFHELGDRARMAASLCSLGITLTALGEGESAATRFFQALDLAQQARATPVMLDALAGLGGLWSTTDHPSRARAVEMAHLVSNHHASSQEARRATKQLLGELSNYLEPDPLFRPAAQELDEVVAELLLAHRRGSIGSA